MAEICSCDTGIVNFGLPNCINGFKRTSRLILVDYLDDTGAVNSIKSTDVLANTFFDGKYNNANLTQRWYITPEISGVDGERADAVTEDVDGINYFVKQGTRNFNGTFKGLGSSPTFIKSLESVSCRQMGLFIVDTSGNIIGMNNAETGDLDPIKIQQRTFQSKFMDETASTSQGVNFKFDWNENERDSDLSFVGAGNITVNMLEAASMSTVVLGEATGIIATAFATPMTFTYGENFVKTTYTGAVFGDFTLFNENTSLAVVVSAAPESPSGTYTITYAAQTAADVLTLSYSKVTGQGFESVVDLSIIAV